MNFELAIVCSVAPDGCQVQLLGSATPIDAGYAAPVLDRIKLRPRQLVIVDMGAAPPEVVWRWFRGQVVYRAGDQAVVDNHRYQPGEHDQLSLVRIPDVLEAPADVGDEVFYSVDRDGPIVDLAIDGLPAHPARLRADLFPALEDMYAELAERRPEED